MIEPYYQDDYCTIYNADCREVLPQLGEFDCVLMDPPYGVNASNKKSHYTGGHFIDDGEYIQEIVNDVLPQLFGISKCTVITCGIKNMWKYPQPDSFGVFYYPAANGWQKWGHADTNPILYYGEPV